MSGCPLHLGSLSNGRILWNQTPIENNYKHISTTETGSYPDISKFPSRKKQNLMRVAIRFKKNQKRFKQNTSIHANSPLQITKMNGIEVDINHLKKGEVNLGTSIMAVKYKDGVILGADSRTTTGSYIANRVTDKLTQVHNKIWCCRSGSAADTQAVADIVKYHLELYVAQHGKEPSAKVAASIFQELTYTNKDALTAGLIVAGFDEKTNGEVFSIPLGGSVHKQPFAIAGSGSAYIYGWTEKNFKEDFTREEVIEFVKTALSQAIKWDGSSGGVIRQVLLTKNGIERLVFYPDEYENA